MKAGTAKKLSEDELTDLLRRKDEAGLEFLYDHYSAALYGVISRIVQEEEIAEDVLQEAYIKIWNNFSSYDPSKGRLFTWMVNITRNLAIDKIRSKEFRNRSQNQDIEKSVITIDQSNRHSYNPDLMGLKELVNKLKPEQKILIDMVYFQGYTQAEVSEKLNMPLGTVKTRLRAAIMVLKKQFN